MTGPRKALILLLGTAAVAVVVVSVDRMTRDARRVLAREFKGRWMAAATEVALLDLDYDETDEDPEFIAWAEVFKETVGFRGSRQRFWLDHKKLSPWLRTLTLQQQGIGDWTLVLGPDGETLTVTRPGAADSDEAGSGGLFRRVDGDREE